MANNISYFFIHRSFFSYITQRARTSGSSDTIDINKAAREASSAAAARVNRHVWLAARLISAHKSQWKLSWQKLHGYYTSNGAAEHIVSRGAWKYDFYERPNHEEWCGGSAFDPRPLIPGWFGTLVSLFIPHPLERRLPPVIRTLQPRRELSEEWAVPDGRNVPGIATFSWYLLARDGEIRANLKRPLYFPQNANHPRLCPSFSYTKGGPALNE